MMSLNFQDPLKAEDIGAFKIIDETKVQSITTMLRFFQSIKPIMELDRYIEIAAHLFYDLYT